MFTYCVEGLEAGGGGGGGGGGGRAEEKLHLLLSAKIWQLL
jgi:hypothetical protein